MNGANCIPIMKALSEIHRLRIVRLLLREQLDVQTIAIRLDISEYNVSKHLRILKDAGLLEVEKSGKQRFYSLAHALKDDLSLDQNVLKLNCCTFHFDKLPK